MSPCHTCLDCITQSLKALEGLSRSSNTSSWRHHNRLSDLWEAAEYGCSFCAAFCGQTRFLEHLGEEKRELNKLQTFLNCRVMSQCIDTPERERHYVYFSFTEEARQVLIENLTNKGWLIAFELWPSEGFSDASFGQPKASSTASDETWCLATHWMTDCLSNHTACNESAAYDWHPTRLLDLGPKHSSTDEIRLVISGSDNVVGPYLTLSHRWGEGSIVKLNKDTMVQLRSGVSPHILPRTFQEAVNVTRRLQVRYLWIDSLCIVQDDKDDWRFESQQMGQVYTHALCNIAATASHDDSGGLFRTRDPSMLHRVQFDVPVAWTGNHRIRSFTALRLEAWGYLLNEAPLNERAWVVQERLLSPRILHFGAAELAWECLEHEACESLPLGLPNQINVSYMFGKRLWGHAMRWRFVEPDHSPHELWSRLQFFYSRCRLTKPEDRLIALSGIAKKFQSLTRDRYIAGMWLGDLPRQIAWVTHHNRYKQSASQPSKQHINAGPSFSWTTIDRPTSFSYWTDSDLHVRVSQVQLNYETTDEFGDATYGSLHLHGHLKSGRFLKRFASDSEYYTWALYTRGSITDEAPAMITDLIYLDDENLDLGELYDANRAFIMPVNSKTFNRAEPRLWCEWLILELLDAAEGRYRRVGMVRGYVGSTEADRITSQRIHEASMWCLRYEPETEYPHTILLV